MRIFTKQTRYASLLAISLISSAGMSYADEGYPKLRFSGFGTLGAVVTDSDDAKFSRDGQLDGATTSPSVKPDSNLGVQMIAQANDWLSATAQLLSMARQDDHISTELEWAFVKATPLDGLAIRAGIMAMPTFMISDFRNVGYANTWLRPPSEVYGMAMLRRLEGVDVSYSMDIQSTTLTASILAGNSEARIFGADYDVKDVKGIDVRLETDWLTLRAGRIESLIKGPEDIYVFSGIGAIVDRDNIIAQAEYVTRESKEGFEDTVDADGWYILAGYRIDSLIPYISYATTEPLNYNSPIHMSETQKTSALGLRWNAFQSASLKFQLESIDTSDTRGIAFAPTDNIGVLVPPVVTGKVTALSAAIDFVF